MPRSDAHEAPLMEGVRSLAELYGWLHFHAPQCEHAARQSEPGFPDLILVRAPRLVAVEIKRALPDKPNVAQRHWLEQLDRVRYADSFILRPGPTFDAMEAELR